MRRKVNKVGINTLTVSLPSDWCKRYGIEKGNELNFFIRDRTIIISPEQEKMADEFIVKIDTPQIFLNRMIFTPYILGYDKLIVQYKDKKVADIVRESIKYLMGFELIEETDSFCVIKNVSKGLEQEFLTIYDGQFKILMNVYNEIENLLIRKEERFDRIKSLDEQFSRFNVFSKRMLNKIGFKDDRKTKGIYVLCTLLELAMDGLTNIRNFILKNGDCNQKILLELFRKSKEHAMRFFNIYRKYDFNKLYELKKIRNEIFMQIEKEISKNSKCNPILMYIYQMTDAIHHCTIEIC